MNNPTKEYGAALIVALFVTALVAISAIVMIERLRMDTRRTELILNDNQATLAAQGSVSWAMDQLINDWNLKQPNKVIDRTPIVSPVNEINGAKISSTIEDAQGKLNLNNLSDPAFQAVFIRLVQLVAPDVSTGIAQAITAGIVDWITLGINNSKFDQYYATINPPYRSAHHFMVSVSELRLIQGMTAKLYEKLLPYVTVLPNKTKFNINSVPIPVLMSFGSSITLDTAKSFNTLCARTPLGNLDLLVNFPAIKNAPIAQTGFTVSSDFFLVTTRVTIGNQQT